MDVRGKLVELLSVGCCPDDGCDFCNYAEFEACRPHFLADHLISNGVTVQEWKPISEPPKEKGTYLVCTDNGGVLLGHWYGTVWNAGSGANKHLAHWSYLPHPPKGE